MRILHVIPSLDAADGGPSKAVIEMCRALRDAGDEVEIAATGKAPPLPPGISAHLFGRRGQLDYKYSPDLAVWLEAEAPQYHLLHVHAVFNHSTHAAAQAARRRGVPYIVRPLGTLNASYALQQSAWKKQIYLKLTARRELDRAAALHCTSQQEKQDLQRMGLRPPKVVIPHGLHLEEFARLPPRGAFRRDHGIPDSAPLFVFLGRLHPKKGFDLLLPALEALALAGHEFRLVVAGAGEPAFVASLKAEAHARGLAARTTWPGMITGERKLALLVDADLFVLPSYNENFGIAVVEAMACGAPVVISDQVDLWPEISQCGAGLVTPCQVSALSQAIERLLLDQDLARRCRAAGPRCVRERLDWKQVVPRLQRLYQAALAGKVDESQI